MRPTTRFAGLSLSDADRELLRSKEQGNTREKLQARDWRIRTLLLLDDGCTVRATAEAVGGYPCEISRVGKRYLAGGLQFVLSDDPRPKPEKMLDSAQEAAIVAMVWHGGPRH